MDWPAVFISIVSRAITICGINWCWKKNHRSDNRGAVGLKAYASGRFCPIVASYFFFTSTFYLIRNTLAFWKLPLAFTQCYRGIIGDTHEHGDVFIYIMHSNKGPQRVAPNRCTRKKSLEDSAELLVHAVWSGLPACINESMIKKDISMPIQ